MSKGPVKKSTDPNPLKDFMEDDLKDPHNTLPAKLQAIEDSFDEYAGYPLGMQAVAAIPGVGAVKSKESFRDAPDFKAAMAEIQAAAANQ